MFQPPFRSPAYTKDRPSGEKLTERSCVGVLVIRLVVPYSTELTKISPLRTKAISFALGDNAISVAP